MKKKAIYCKDDVSDMGGIQDHAVPDFFLFWLLIYVSFLGFKVNYTICFQVKKNQHGVFLQHVHCYTADPVVTHSISL